MNTQARTHRLQAGQALTLSGRRAGSAVLAEGELWVQAPADWMAGTLVLPRPLRLVAPAVLPVAPAWSCVAVRASTVLVAEPAPRPAAARWLAAAASLLSGLRSWGSGGSRKMLERSRPRRLPGRRLRKIAG